MTVMSLTDGVAKTVNILGVTNGGGLSRDIDVLRQGLEELGYVVLVNRNPVGDQPGGRVRGALKRVRESRLWRAVRAHGWMRSPCELNIHLEEIHANSLGAARRNVLIPNQEWFRDWFRPYLPQIDEVWAKSYLAERLFADLGCKARFLGWSSADRRASGTGSSKPLTALHIAGASRAKGTEAVLDVWSRNPDWPLLRVLRQDRGYAGNPHPWRERAAVPNIQILTERVDDVMLRRLQNESALWVRPSEAEGFGHVIAEGMSVGAVVITTDAPPMNELVTPGTGLLVAAERSRPMGLGERYFVNLEDLERKIQAALDMTDTEREAMGRAARARFEAMNEGFRERLKVCLGAILAEADGGANRAALPEVC